MSKDGLGMRILVTGCAGFIGSQFCRQFLDNNEIVGLNRMTSLKNMKRLDGIKEDARFSFYNLDIVRDELDDALEDVECVVNFAAKTHVDHSIHNPEPFIEDNFKGTFKVLEAVRRSKSVKRYVQVSTDEVYGPILEGNFDEESPLNPSNPYSACKAGADMLTLSYKNTYGIPAIITRTENNYGGFQSREKAIPTFVRKSLNNEPIPVYGDGKHRRMWLHVEDHCTAIKHLIDKGATGIYHIGGEQEMENIELAKLILKLTGKPDGKINFLVDHDARPGHDRRYALTAEKVRATGWKPKWTVDEGFKSVIKWYVDNQWWFM